MKKIKITERLEIGGDLVLIAGPCVAESFEICCEIAEKMIEITSELGIPYIFKASFDKANRSSASSFRGPGLEKGLQILADIKDTYNVPVVTDIHETSQVKDVASVVDILQIPAYLCRQTDLLVACGETGLPVNIKKGQFMAPEDMKGAVDKVKSTGNEKVLLTERGTTFGYHNLVVDMRSLVIMRNMNVPVVFDATHSVQLPGGLGNASGGQREFVKPLTCAATAIGIDVLFLEVHPHPDKAMSDGPNSLDFEMTKDVLKAVLAIKKGINNV